MADIFVSYSRKDLARSEAIYALLEREGYSVAIDRGFLTAGDDFRQRIGEELLQVKVVIVLWSADSVESAFVRDEASRAARQTVLLQLIIDDMPDSGVPLGFGELQRIRCAWTAEGALAVESRHELVAALERHLPAVEPLGAAIAQLKREVDTRLGAECEVLERLGTGRMSVVFRSRHQMYGVVALKVTPLAGILLLPGFYAEFRRCIEATRELAHPNILSIRDVRLLDTIACTILDYVEGESLARCIARSTPRMPIGRIKDMASNIASALAHAHQNGIVHSSLSPSNILIEQATDRALVSDFGMPNLGRGPEATAGRALFLDARYVSPEQCLGHAATPQSDQYALGAILYEMLTGRPPFVGSSGFAIMRGHCDDMPPPIAKFRPGCPVGVAGSVMRMLAKKPKERYVTTCMLAHEIADWPLAESLRPTNVAVISESARAAKLALESYSRCLADPDFLAIFYKRLQDDLILGSHFEAMNFDRQVGALRRALRHLLEFAWGQEDARRELDRVATSHRRFRLDESQVRAFVDTLIELAVERDRDPGQGARPGLREVWRLATKDGLQHFIELAGVAPPRESKVVPSDAAVALGEGSVGRVAPLA